MHVIAGLPRSGSTLLCNILNQNPRFHATSTTESPVLLAKMIHHVSTGIELKSDLARDREGTTRRIEASMRAYFDSWYSEHGDKVVFDKCRAWGHHALALRALYPDSKMIIMVRDLREVFSSIEKQHRKTPLFEESSSANAKTIFARADKKFSPGGMIGNPLEGIKDLIDRQLDCLFVRYEDLAEFPDATMSKIYCYLLEEPFQHDFDDVKNTATDPDHLYLYKFPHKGCGKVEPRPPQWREFMSEEIGATIMARFEWFNDQFRYGSRPARRRRGSPVRR